MIHLMSSKSVCLIFSVASSDSACADEELVREEEAQAGWVPAAVWQTATGKVASPTSLRAEAFWKAARRKVATSPSQVDPAYTLAGNLAMASPSALPMAALEANWLQSLVSPRNVTGGHLVELLVLVCDVLDPRAQRKPLVVCKP